MIQTKRHQSKNYEQTYKGKWMIKLVNHHIMRARGKIANEFTIKLEAEELPIAIGPPAGAKPGSAPEDGTVVFGIVIDPPASDSGAGAGANSESRGTEVGGAMRVGNCWGPGHRG